MQVWILLCLHFCKSASPALLLTSIALLILWIPLITLLLLLCLTQFTLVWIFVCLFFFLFQSFPCPLTMFETLKFLLVSVKVDDHKSHLTIHLKTGAAFLSHPNHFYTFFFFFLGIHYVCFWAGTAFLFSKSFWFYVISGYEDLMGDFCIKEEISDIPSSVIITSYIPYNFSNA